MPKSMSLVILVDGSEIPRPTTWYVQNPVNNGIFTISISLVILAVEQI